MFVVGGRAFTSVILQRNCHEFIAYENLNRSRKPAAKGERPVAAAAAAPISQAFPIVRRALKILSDREVSPQTGLLKSTLLQLDSTFSERNYGASSFLDFVEKLAQAGLVLLKHSGRSVMVELVGTFSSEAEPAETPAAAAEATPPAARPIAAVPAVHGGHHPPSQEEPVGPQAGTNADGVRLAGQILKSATTARWPMYVRNVKQLLRAYRDASPGANGDGSAAGFDERRYGFGGLMDLLRACQREELVRVERDRRGGLRVFPGPALQRTGLPHPEALAQPSEIQPIAAESVRSGGSRTDRDRTDPDRYDGGAAWPCEAEEAARPLNARDGSSLGTARRSQARAPETGGGSPRAAREEGRAGCGRRRERKLTAVAACGRKTTTPS